LVGFHSNFLKWRSEGKQVIMYLDDGLGIEQDDELCKAVVNQVKCDLINSGMISEVNIKYKHRGFKFDMLSSSPHVFKFYTLLP
jgi:hypothetical protein